MLVFIPKDSGVILDKMKLEIKDVETRRKFTLFKMFTNIQIPYADPTGNGEVLQGDVYRVPTNPQNINFKGINLHPVSVVIKQYPRKIIYLYMLVPLSELPLYI